ncbi:MAG: addiction module protein [Verrucomicrobia bacterium]|nr:addiction module protein [Verrucomicrobiota bacterium]
MDPAILQKEALRLPESERALLADRLLESLSRTPPELEAAWLREADARMAAFMEERIEAVDGLRAMAELRARFPR